MSATPTSSSRDTPTVSVCVPTYNYARFLPDAIESVLQQSFRDFELVITDDASTDSTASIVNAYARQDSRVRYVLNERRLGMNGNLKRAADLARGRYIKMLCADDWLTPNCLERLVPLLDASPDVVLATSACIVTDEQGTPREVNFLFGEGVSRRTGDSMIDAMSREEGFGGNSSFFIRRAAYLEVGGYDAELLYAADYDLGARLCLVGDYIHTDEPLFYGRMQSQSSSSLDPRELKDVKDRFRIPQKIFAPRPPLSRTWLRYHRLTGRLTARYAVNTLLQYLRGETRYARDLARVLYRAGNFSAALPLFPQHLVTRAIRRALGTHRPRSKRVAPWMRRPSRLVLP